MSGCRFPMCMVAVDVHDGAEYGISNVMSSIVIRIMSSSCYQMLQS